MKLLPVYLTIIFNLSADLANAQNAMPDEFIDEKFRKKAKSVIVQYSADIKPGSLKYPEPWTEDVNESRNNRTNKVRTVRNALFRSEYDKNGKIILKECFGLMQFANQRSIPGSKDEFKRDPDGNIIYRASTSLVNPDFVHARTFNYAGDTLYIKWTINGVPKGLGLFYHNIYVDKDLATDIVSIYIYHKDSLSTGYLIKELMRNEKQKEFKEINAYRFNSNDLLVGYTSSGVAEEYSYNSNGLLIERRFYLGNRLKEKMKIVRNSSGLITEYIDQKGPFDKKQRPKSETRILCEYEFYD